MTQRREHPRERPWTPWLVLALCLHALGWLVVRAPGRAQPSPPVLSAANEASISIELDANELEGSSAPGESAALEPARAALPQRAGHGQPTANSKGAELAALGQDTAGNEAPGSELESPSTASTDPATAAATPEPGLSLERLGLGSENPFVSREAPRRASPREVGRMRFQKAMAADIVRAEQAVGLGPEGPAITQLEAATRTGNPQPNSNALFEFTTDSGGKLLSVELLESSSDPAPWRRIAQGTRAALGSTRLRLPKAGYGVTFRVRVISHVELPSGADPGLAVNIAGIPVKRGRGPRSTSINILGLVPRFADSEVELPSGQTMHVPTLSLGPLLSVAGDPADIGSPERRMVRAHLESLTVNDAKATDTL